MAFSTFTNRNGTLYVYDRQITSDVRTILDRFNKDNNSALDQDDLRCVIVEVQEEMADTARAEVFDLSVAILINSKNYLIKDEKALIDDLQCYDIDLYLDCRNCFHPSSIESTQGPAMYFVLDKAA